MSADRDPLEELLASVADGRAVDWDAARRAASPSEQARLGSLREASQIADFHRTLQGEEKVAAFPERWGDLLLLERIGAGAKGEVYRAWDPTLQREVALKLLRPDNDSESLLDEGRAAARVRHPHAVVVHGIDRRDGRMGLWMELIRGPSLEQEVREHGPLRPEDVARLGVEAGSALAAFHAAGLLHRDVKPANIVRDAEGRHVLTDLGLGLRFDLHGTGAAPPSGTPVYMAPELLSGAPASERSDLYSLGMVLWFALTGSHPFEVTTLAELVSAAHTGPTPRLRERRTDAPAALAAVVERAIMPRAADRFLTAGELVEALEAVRRESAPKTRRGLLVAASIAVVVLGVAGFLTWRARDTAPPVSEPAAPAGVEPIAYAVEASFLRRGTAGTAPLVSGDRVRPGDRLSLQIRATRPAWVYVLNEDQRGERYLLFPQPRFDTQNPLGKDSTFVLPGAVDGKENAWTVTSAGGKEYFLVVASPEPVPEIEAELARLPAPVPGKPVTYSAQVGDAVVERLRGVGGTEELPATASRPAPGSPLFDRFKALAGRETNIRGIWVRQIVLDNPTP